MRGYPTLLFLNSSGEVVHRLLGADKASALLEKVKLGVESGGISGLRKRYEAGERDSAFVCGYINVLSAANREEEAGKVAADFYREKNRKYWNMKVISQYSTAIYMISTPRHFYMW